MLDDDFAHLTGDCYLCKRENLPSTAFDARDLRRFLAEQSSSRGRAFTDARTSTHAATKATQVAGKTLFCSDCVAKQNAAAAAADDAWNDDEDDAPAVVRAAAPPATQELEQEDAADSWEDL